MYRILGKRGSGKTTNLITLAKETGAILVVSNVDYAVNKMYQLGITGVDIMSYTQFANSRISSDKQYLVDDIEGFTKVIFGKNFVGYSQTIDD